MSKKTIIIGAGLGGLISGILIKKAKPDDEVIIYDMNKIPGGLCTAFKKATTYNGEKLTYTINIPLITSDLKDDDIFGEFLKYMGVKNIHWRVVDKLFQYYPLEGNPFKFDKNGDKEILNLAQSKKERKSLQKYLDKMYTVFYDLFHRAHYPPKASQAIKMLFTIPSTVFALMNDKPYLKTIEKIGIKTEEIKNILCVPEAFMGVDVDKVSALGEMVMIQSFLNKFGLQPDKGDSFQTLSDNLADRFKELGGKLVLGKTVDSIAFDKNRAKGVIIDGKLEESDVVMIGVAQDKIKSLLEAGKNIGSIKKLIKKVNKLPYPNSDYYCYYLIDKRAVEEEPRLTEFAYHIYKLPECRDESNWKLALWVPDDLINNKYYILSLVMTEQSQDKIDQWIELRKKDPKKYDEEKEKVAQKYMEMVMEVEPVFKKYPPLKHVLTMTPASYLPYGTKYPICGLAQVPENFGMNRMASKILDNLFIASGACFSGGIWGAFAGGWHGFVNFYKSIYGIEIGNRDLVFKPGLKNLP